ncbi:hypothetical protein KL86DES1_10180 [uncultured Desulfovibrio sp.]|uniref:Uncharacterized protein n=1 Tax=uncultured Desulfovibrio sp. TaxID=167968 RepID=A0A212KY85_9BACT|nr:hypothetical protein KL86DES1_10180 [uncultured Desulfovibrio sp.]VZH35390.1 conserved protein of unknown function [Desulfovibrio sp. 86]
MNDCAHFYVFQSYLQATPYQACDSFHPLLGLYYIAIPGR